MVGSIDWKGVQRVLVVKLSSLGDVLMATPVAQALREFLPHAEIGWAVEKRCLQIVEGNPHLSHVHVWDRTGKGFKWFKGFWRVVTEVRQRRYQLAFDLQCLLKSALIARLSGATERVGFSDGREGSRWFLTSQVNPQPSYHRVAGRYLHLLQEAGVPADPDRYRLLLPTLDADEQAVERVLHSTGLKGKPFVVLAPATTEFHRHWVEERWSQLAVRIWQDFGVVSVLLGGATDASLLSRIAAACSPKPIVFGGTLSLKQAAVLVRSARVLVGLDSFPIHLAFAVGTPVVALYGPKFGERWYGERNVAVLEYDLPCRPCYHHPTCGGEFKCMRLITVAEVVTALASTLA